MPDLNNQQFDSMQAQQSAPECYPPKLPSAEMHEADLRKPRAGYVFGVAISGLIVAGLLSKIIGIALCITGFCLAYQDLKRNLTLVGRFLTQASFLISTIGFAVAILKIILTTIMILTTAAKTPEFLHIYWHQLF